VLDRFLAFLDSPLDPRAGRAMLAFAAAILLGFAILFVLGAGGSDRTPVSRESAPSGPARPLTQLPPQPVTGDTYGAKREKHVRRQDPQDERGSPAAGRAAEALRSRRALQHVPYRTPALTVLLRGARGGRAVLRVSAATFRAARRGWRRFLRRYDDVGRAYLPILRVERGSDG
jgi:hypothetical protein